MVASQNVLRTDSVCVNKSEGGDTGDWYILITKKTHTLKLEDGLILSNRG